MLKIAWRDGDVKNTVVKLEGRMLGPWVEEVRLSCTRLLDEGRVLTLDLEDVSFLDLGGIELLKQLADRSVRFINCGAFVTELLRSAGFNDRSGQCQ